MHVHTLLPVLDGFNRLSGGGTDGLDGVLVFEPAGRQIFAFSSCVCIGKAYVGFKISLGGRATLLFQEFVSGILMAMAGQGCMLV